MVEFGGWHMPIQYTGIVEEHQTVREALGLFDISHMGQFRVSGPQAESWLDSVLTNRVTALQPGQCQYTFLLNERGGIIDDLILYRYEPDHWLLVVNASKVEEDWNWLHQRVRDGVIMENLSDSYAGLAIQGPASVPLFDLFFGENHSRPARNEIHELQCGDISFLISRTGYTGEDGFELFFPAEHAVHIWRKILEMGSPLGIKPCGLGARDTLRLEMCYPLNGSDLSPDHTPLEAGLSIFVDLEKPEFTGHEALKAQKAAGVTRRLVPFMLDEGSPPPRPNYPVLIDNTEVGEVASGTLSPSLKRGIGMAYLPTPYAKIDQPLEIQIRQRTAAGRVVRKPFYRKS